MAKGSKFVFFLVAYAVEKLRDLVLHFLEDFLDDADMVGVEEDLAELQFAETREFALVDASLLEDAQDFGGLHSGLGIHYIF